MGICSRSPMVALFETLLMNQSQYSTLGQPNAATYSSHYKSLTANTAASSCPCLHYQLLLEGHQCSLCCLNTTNVHLCCLKATNVHALSSKLACRQCQIPQLTYTCLLGCYGASSRLVEYVKLTCGTLGHL